MKVHTTYEYMAIEAANYTVCDLTTSKSPYIAYNYSNLCKQANFLYYNHCWSAQRMTTIKHISRALTREFIYLNAPYYMYDHDVHWEISS